MATRLCVRARTCVCVCSLSPSLTQVYFSLLSPLLSRIQQHLIQTGRAPQPSGAALRMLKTAESFIHYTTDASAGLSFLFSSILDILCDRAETCEQKDHASFYCRWVCFF